MQSALQPPIVHAPNLPPMRSSRYLPKVGDTTTIDLPGECTRAEITRVISDEAVIVRLMTYTTSKDHNYKKGDYVACRLVVNDMNKLQWEIISEEELNRASQVKAERIAEKIEAMPPDEPPPAPPQINLVSAVERD